MIHTVFLIALFTVSVGFSLGFLPQTRCIARSQHKTIVMAVEFNWKQFKKATEEKMGKSVENIQNQFNTLRAGGANPAMLDRVFVDYFGTPTPLTQVARVGNSGSQQLVVEPFDKALLKEIEKAISTADLNLTPTNDGSGVIRINVSKLCIRWPNISKS
jgi:hypothetical protein